MMQEADGGAAEKSPLDKVVVEEQRGGPSPGRSQSPGGSSRTQGATNSPAAEDDQDVDDDLLGKRNGGEMEAGPLDTRV